MDVFLHGLETEERDAGNPRFVATIDSGIIFLVGTAPGASTDLFPANQPRVVRGYNGLPQGLGATGTLPDQLARVLDQAGRHSPTIYFSRVEEGATPAETLANVLGDRAAKTGIHSLSLVQPEYGQRPKLLAAPGFTSTRPTDGISDINVTAGGANYTSPPTVTVTRGAGDTTGAGAEAIAVLNDAGEVSEIVVTNPGANYTAVPTATLSGGGGTGATATAMLGTVANPVAMGLNILANRYRAMVAVSGPNTTDEAAVTYRLDFDSQRLMVIDPFGKFEKAGAPTAMPAEAAVLGLQSRIDYEKGFWHSPSNHVIEGLLGTARPIEHSFDRSAQSQYLNSQHVSTLVRAPQGGWKLWGNRVATADPLHVFWSRRRAHDVIIESIELACEFFVDKPFSKQNLVDIADTVNRALRRWQALGATLGGRVWLDPSINTKESMSAGMIYVDYDGESPAPMEHIVFRFNRNTGYYDTLLASAAREIARQAALSA